MISKTVPETASSGLETPSDVGIKADIVTAYITRPQEDRVSVATINRELATLRRALQLANEWGDLMTAPPKIYLTRW